MPPSAIEEEFWNLPSTTFHKAFDHRCLLGDRLPIQTLPVRNGFFSIHLEHILPARTLACRNRQERRLRLTRTMSESRAFVAIAWNANGTSEASRCCFVVCGNFSQNFFCHNCCALNEWEKKKATDGPAESEERNGSRNEKNGKRKTPHFRIVNASVFARRYFGRRSGAVRRPRRCVLLDVTRAGNSRHPPARVPECQKTSGS